MLVFLLIAVAAGLALTAWLTESLLLGYLAAGLALASVVLVFGYAWLERRRDASAAQESADGDATVSESASDVVDEPAAPDGEAPDGEAQDGAAVDTTADAAPGEPADSDEAPERVSPLSIRADLGRSGDEGIDLVRVIPGRKRFHEPGCSLLAGRDSEELTREEAGEEGFTACSRCGTGRARQVG